MRRRCSRIHSWHSLNFNFGQPTMCSEPHHSTTNRHWDRSYSCCFPSCSSSLFFLSCAETAWLPSSLPIHHWACRRSDRTTSRRMTCQSRSDSQLLHKRIHCVWRICTHSEVSMRMQSGWRKLSRFGDVNQIIGNIKSFNQGAINRALVTRERDEIIVPWFL